MKLNDLRPAPGARPERRRVGRGHGSGRGKTAGRGTKGQKSRSGAAIPAWFEGGQTPIHVRTPKLHGFRNRGRVEYAPVNLTRLADAASGTLVTPEVLVHDGLLADTRRPVKILGGGEAPKGLTIHAHAVSRSAAEKLEAAGSTVQLISWPDGTPVEPETDEERAAREAKRARRAARTRAAAGPEAKEEEEEEEEAGEARASAREAQSDQRREAAADEVEDASQAADEGESEPTA